MRMGYDDRHSRDDVSNMKSIINNTSTYNPRTLPNTMSEAVRWLGVSDLPYEAYFSTPGGACWKPNELWY